MTAPSPFNPEREKAVIEALELLQRSDGWKYVQAYLAGQKAQLESDLLNMQSPLPSEAVQRSLGALWMIREVDNFLKANVDARKMMLERAAMRAKNKEG